jgi:vesicle-fusing ATPase
MVSPERMVGLSEAGKCAKIAKIFTDSYKSPLSLIIMDDIERLLEYVPIGPRFSNTILQTVMVLVKKAPPVGHKLLVIGTTSNLDVMENMDLSRCFNAVLTMPPVKSGDEVATVLRSLDYFSEDEIRVVSPAIHQTIPIKQLLMVSDLAKQSATKSQPLAERFVECLESFCGGNF